MDDSDSDFIPSKIAGAMQLRTRQKRKFDEVEAKLPDQKALQASTLSVSGILNRIINLNLFGKAVARGDVVWLFDNTAFKTSESGPWQAEFVAAVFEQEAKCRVADMVSGVAGAVGLADDAEERDTIEERLMPFMWDIRPARTITAVQDGGALRLGPTGFNGISANVLKLPENRKGFFAKTTADVTGGVEGILTMHTYFAGIEGWGVISGKALYIHYLSECVLIKLIDIDDTIKITSSSDPVGILRETFVNQPSPVPRMPELYADIESFLPRVTPWFYLSASPYNLYPFLKEFRDQYYPPGTLILRDSSWKTVSGILSALTMGTEEYKVDRMKKINSWLPKRKMIVIGDSSQSDPEAYGEMYRAVPGWIRLILIRKDTDSAAFGLEEKNEPKRFERAFKGIPRDAWHVFEDPAECLDIVKDAVGRN